MVECSVPSLKEFTKKIIYSDDLKEVSFIAILSWNIILKHKLPSLRVSEFRKIIFKDVP